VPTGIVRTAIDADTHALSIDYDPRLISDQSIREVAERLAPEAQRRFDKCICFHDRRVDRPARRIGADGGQTTFRRCLPCGRGSIDVDLLMVLAALGAAAVGAPFNFQNI